MDAGQAFQKFLFLYKTQNQLQNTEVARSSKVVVAKDCSMGTIDFNQKYPELHRKEHTTSPKFF